jgi:uncharacterized protein (TIGR02757 family)
MNKDIAPKDLRAFLDKKVAEYNRASFISNDPISIPHEYTLRQDIEIAAFFTAIFSWGNRTTIIRKSQELMQLMDRSPYQFVLQHEEKDLQKFLDFRHRTFNATDLLYFIAFFRFHYSNHPSLEDAFLLPREGPGTREKNGGQKSGAGQRAVSGQKSLSGQKGSTGQIAGVRQEGWRAEHALSAFYHYFFSAGEAPPRTAKHIASPDKHSACKRINMFLRWMVRRDDKGVDFGIWQRIPISRLICPLDLHVARVARRFGLLDRKPSDWLAAMELTDHLRLLDPKDPTKYDFALFGLGAMEKF